MTATIQQLDTSLDPNFPKKVLEKTDAQLRFSTDDEEWEGEWSFIYESNDSPGS